MSERPGFDDYQRFFESAPIKLHQDGWYYGMVFAIERGRDRLVVTLAPDNMELGFEWHQEGRLLLQGELVQIHDWIIESKDDAEYLIAKGTGERPVLAVIWLKPEIKIQVHQEWG